MNRAVEEINSRVSIPDVLTFYGYPTNRKKRIPCPLHRGKDPNFCYTDNVFHCWSCGEKGNVITLVMKLHNISFGDALMRINSDFNLGLETRRPSRQERMNAIENAKVEKAAQEIEILKKRYYSGIAVFHREVFKKLCKNPDDEFLKELESQLEQWLDDNIEEVTQPWILITQKKTF